MNCSEYSDRELLILLDEGKPQADHAFTELYNRYSQEVYRFCLFLASNKSLADDIFQETFVKYLAKKEHKCEVINVKAYLIRTAKNLYLNRHRDAKFSNIDDLSEILEADLTSYDDKELAEIIMRSLELIDEDYREAFILRVIEGMTYKEIGEILNISWSGAQSRVVRAKEKLLKILKPYINDYKKNI